MINSCRISAVILLLLGINVCQAPAETGNRSTTVSITGFLEMALTDPAVEQQGEISRFLETAPGNIPFFRSLELRSETDRFNLSNQKYALRFYPGSLAETRSSRRWQQGLLDYSLQQKRLLLHQALTRRYLLVLDYLQIEEELALQREQLRLLQDWLQSGQSKEIAAVLDFTDLVRFREQLTRTELAVVELLSEQQQVENEIRLLLPDGAGFDFDGSRLPEVATIAERIQVTRPGLSPYLEQSRNRMMLAENEYELESARERRIVSFLELNYDHDNHLAPEESFFLEFGIRLPFPPADRQDLNQLQLEQLELQSDHQLLTQKLQLELSRTHAEIELLLEQLALLDSQDGCDSTSLPASAGLSPGTLLRWWITTIEGELLRLDLRYSLLEAYIEYLDLTGLISSAPTQNWLDAGLSALSISLENQRHE